MKNKIYLWDTSLIYPSLFIYDKILVLNDSAIDFALKTVEYAQENKVTHEEITSMIRDGVIVPIIVYTDRDELRDSYRLFSASSIKEAKKIANSIGALWDIMMSPEFVEKIIKLPKKIKEQILEILDPSKTFTRQYIFVDYYPEPRPSEKTITRKYRASERISHDIYQKIEEHLLKNRPLSVYRNEICLASELCCSITIAKAFNCSVLEEAPHIRFYRELLQEVEREIANIPELRRTLLETNKIAAIKEVMRPVKLRIPDRIHFSKIREFRRDSAHRNFNKWLNLVYCNAQEEQEIPQFDENILSEFNALLESLQSEISKRSLIASATLTGFASFLTTLYPAAIFAVVSALASYVPFTYAFAKLYKEVSKNNFVFYFLSWKKQPIKV
jgi:hypothetical protein